MWESKTQLSLTVESGERGGSRMTEEERKKRMEQVYREFMQKVMTLFQEAGDGKERAQLEEYLKKLKEQGIPEKGKKQGE